MVDAEEYVENGSVKWGGVAGAFVGGFLALVGYASARWIALWAGAATAAMDGVAWFQASLVSLPFDGATGIIRSAWTSFATFLPTLGILAFPVAVITTVVVLYVLFWGVSRIVWGY